MHYNYISLSPTMAPFLFFHGMYAFPQTPRCVPPSTDASYEKEKNDNDSKYTRAHQQNTNHLNTLQMIRSNIQNAPSNAHVIIEIQLIIPFALAGCSTTSSTSDPAIEFGTLSESASDASDSGLIAASGFASRWTSSSTTDPTTEFGTLSESASDAPSSESMASSELERRSTLGSRETCAFLPRLVGVLDGSPSCCIGAGDNFECPFFFLDVAFTERLAELALASWTRASCLATFFGERSSPLWCFIS